MVSDWNYLLLREDKNNNNYNIRGMGIERGEKEGENGR